MTTHSVAHTRDMNHYGQASYPDGLVPWSDALAPDIEAGRTTGRLRACGYCGSMHPADVAAAIRQGAQGHWADRKYGWPHKAYFEGVPNPNAGALEVTSYTSHPSDSYPVEHTRTKFDPNTGERREEKWYSQEPRPAPERTHGKFYSVHMQDASDEDRALIEQHLGIAFTFTDDGRVIFKPAAVAGPSATSAESGGDGRNLGSR
jgi:hypothetical protein